MHVSTLTFQVSVFLSQILDSRPLLSGPTLVERPPSHRTRDQNTSLWYQQRPQNFHVCVTEFELVVINIHTLLAQSFLCKLSALPDHFEQGFHFHCKRYRFVDPAAISILPQEVSTEAMILDELDEVASGSIVGGQR